MAADLSAGNRMAHSLCKAFPDDICCCRAEAAQLSDLFSDRLNREMLQAVLGRSNPRYVTPADLDFNFPPESSVMQSCKRITEAGHAWRGTRCGPHVLGEH